ncbi:MAG TPA: hypothetical protein VNS09_20210 [Solirubrobacter sp.]|nr:hypothetical protein [Solirubrobacter sp.]
MRTTLLPVAMVVVGVALIVRMAVLGNVIGIVLGLLFVAAGGGRLYVERGR